MPFELPPLPYPRNALEPVVTENTINFHYGKHHQAYVTNLNNLVPDCKKTLEELIMTETGGIFNNAAQIWNHTFYWNCMCKGGKAISGDLKVAIEKKWGSMDKFVEEFTKAAISHFGSGWCWLVKTKDGQLEIMSTHDAANPMRDGKKPLLTCDVWEHAYYLDYQNLRASYVKQFWTVVNWDFVAKNFH